MTIECNEQQAITLMRMCEFMSRLYAGQTDIFHEMGMSREDQQEMKRKLFPELSPTSYYAIHSQQIPEDARILWDFYQVLRYTIAWAHAPNKPEKRDWRTQIGVCYDEPMRVSDQPLPVVSNK